jgi:hypothetical protein
MKTRKPHKQIWSKINAPVDEGIVELIGAMAMFPKLQTIESCQGEPAWVCFTYGMDGWRELAEFVLGYFGPALSVALGDRISVSIQIEESGRIQGEITVCPGLITATTETIKQLARDYVKL